MNTIKRGALFWAVGFIALSLAGCDNVKEATQTVAANAKAPVTSMTLTSDKQLHKKALPEVVMPEVVMYKPPTCDCCTGWAEHLRKAGFTVVIHKRDDMDAIKSNHGVTQKLASCHTAIVDGYVIEGHVPAADVQRLLTERPDIVGLTAPGMPMKSPGMQKPGQAPKNYDVLAFEADGTSHIFTHY
jgi:hypothetical protein